MPISARRSAGRSESDLELLLLVRVIGGVS
jgi:hypothetical protein